MPSASTSPTTADTLVVPMSRPTTISAVSIAALHVASQLRARGVPRADAADAAMSAANGPSFAAIRASRDRHRILTTTRSGCASLSRKTTPGARPCARELVEHPRGLLDLVAVRRLAEVERDRLLADGERRASPSLLEVELLRSGSAWRRRRARSPRATSSSAPDRRGRRRRDRAASCSAVMPVTTGRSTGSPRSSCLKSSPSRVDEVELAADRGERRAASRSTSSIAMVRGELARDASPARSRDRRAMAALGRARDRARTCSCRLRCRRALATCSAGAALAAVDERPCWIAKRGLVVT